MNINTGLVRSHLNNNCAPKRHTVLADVSTTSITAREKLTVNCLVSSFIKKADFVSFIFVSYLPVRRRVKINSDHHPSEHRD